MADVRALPLAGERSPTVERADRRALALRRVACRRGPRVHRRRRRPRRRLAPRPRWQPARCRCWKRADGARPRGPAAHRAAERVRADHRRARRPSRSRRPASRPSGRSGTFQFAAAEARKLAGEMVPLDAIAAGRGQDRLHPARARSGSSARSRRSTSRSTWSPTSWPRPSPPAARWCSSRPARRRSVGDRAGRAADRRVRAARRAGCTS